MEHAIHLRLQRHDLPEVHRIPKIDVIHRSRHHIAVRVPVRGQRRGHINKVHHLPSQKLSQRVRLCRQNDFGHLGTRRADRLPLQIDSLLSILSSIPFHPHLLALRAVASSCELCSLCVSALSFPILLCALSALSVLRVLCVNSFFFLDFQLSTVSFFFFFLRPV